MKKPVYIPTIEQWTKAESERQEMQTFREQMQILGLALAVAVVGFVAIVL